MSAESNPFVVEWEEASPDVLQAACCLSQKVVAGKLAELIGMHAVMRKIHAEASRRGMIFPDLFTAAEKAALEFVTQNPLQN